LSIKTEESGNTDERGSLGIDINTPDIRLEKCQTFGTQKNNLKGQSATKILQEKATRKLCQQPTT